MTPAGWFDTGSTDEKEGAPMKPISLSVALLALSVTGAWADAATRVPNFVVAEQVADAPSGPSSPADQDKAGNPGQSPSEKLSQQKGVLHPPPTGDHAVIQPPPGEKPNKSVIPPPGTPGGDQSVQPK